MFALIVLIVFGLGISYFATQNTGLVHVIVGSYVFTGIPLYMLLIGAMLLGIFVSWIIHVVNSFSSFMTIHDKDTALRDERKTIKELEKKNYELSLELARLKGEKHEIKQEVEDKEPVYHPSLIERIRSNFA